MSLKDFIATNVENSGELTAEALDRFVEQGKRAPLPPHWYFTYIRECPLCGRTHSVRVRRFDPRPDDPSDRFEYAEVWDWCGAL